MNLQLTTPQKVVAIFIGMIILTVGLGIVARLVGAYYSSTQTKCTVDTSQAAQLNDQGLTSVDQVVCGTPQK